MSAFIITGRTLKDWRAAGKNPTPDQVFLYCIACNTALTVSRQGAEILLEHRDAGDAPCGPICTKCLLKIQHFEAIEMSDLGKQVTTETAMGAAILAIIKNRVEP